MFCALYMRLRSILKGISCLAVLASAAMLFAATGRAHIVTETPWHPVAASYLTMMFMADLKPVPWSKVRTSFTKPQKAAFGMQSAQAKLTGLDAALGEAAASRVLKAIDAEDRQALYDAATRALSQAVRLHLANAAATNDPSIAVREILSAQEIYRAVSDFIRQTDPPAFRTLGRAWLTLTSSAGSSGVIGSGQTPADRSSFDTARRTIETYLVANFEPRQFTPRTKLTPVPETIAAAGDKVQVAPWLPPGSNMNDQDPLPRLVLNFEQEGIDEADLPMVAYGDMLFDSPEIFGDPARSLGLTCSTCHNRSDINRSFFVPGISHQAGALDVDSEYFNARFNDRRDDSIDIPSLRGVRFTGPYGRNGRIASLREFTRNVIVGEFAGAEPSAFVLDALVAYMFEFDFLPNSKLTGGGLLTATASDAARRGEKIFRKPFAGMQNKSCATCHVPSANFLDRLAHDIGSQTSSYTDGRATAYDTPTLLGTRSSAPYFHDGSLPTLASVVDWFNLRFALGLSDAERADLTAYVETVGDADEPYEVYSGRHTRFRLAFEELTTFASTLDTLLPARDTAHAKLLIDTVATDLAADASGMTNLPAKSKVYELSRLLVDVGTAVDAGDWAQAQEHWTAFKTLQDKYDAAMY